MIWPAEYCCCENS